jgi:tetratricopeptide (TPR) repeat protein
MIALARDSESPFDLAYARCYESWLNRWLKEPRRGVEAATQALAVSEKHGLAFCIPLARHCLGWARAELGGAGEGISLIRQASAGMIELGATVENTVFLAGLAEALSLAGNIDEALCTIEEALQANQEELIYLPHVLTCRGNLRLKLGNAEPAEANFRDAIALAQKMSAKAMGAARDDRPRAIDARYQSARRGSEDTRRHLRLVHRGFRHRRPEGRQGAAR